MKLLAQKQYPTELHINEETYALKFVDSCPDWDQENDVGLCDAPNNTIYIKKGLSKAATLRAVIHEIIHALEAEYEFELAHEHVYQLEKAIADTILMNF